MLDWSYDGGAFDPDAPLVVLIHGAGMDHTAWRYQTRYLAHHGRRVLALDLPGHGRNEGPALRTVEEMAGWVAARIRHQGDRANVIGHSLGGLIALELAARETDLVSSLVLLACSVPMPVLEALMEGAIRSDPKAIAMIIGWSFARPSRLGGHPEPGLWQTGLAARMLEHGLGVLGTDLAACKGYIGGSAATARIVQPCLIVAGRQDRMVPMKSVSALAEAIKGAELAVIDAGHMMTLEAPEAIRGLLSGFVPSR